MKNVDSSLNIYKKGSPSLSMNCHLWSMKETLYHLGNNHVKQHPYTKKTKGRSTRIALLYISRSQQHAGKCQTTTVLTGWGSGRSTKQQAVYHVCRHRWKQLSDLAQLLLPPGDKPSGRQPILPTTKGYPWDKLYFHLTELLHITAWIVWNGNVFDN